MLGSKVSNAPQKEFIFREPSHEAAHLQALVLVDLGEGNG